MIICECGYQQKYDELLHTSEFYREQLEDELKNQQENILELEEKYIQLKQEINFLKKNKDQKRLKKIWQQMQRLQNENQYLKNIIEYLEKKSKTQRSKSQQLFDSNISLNQKSSKNLLEQILQLNEILLTNNEHSKENVCDLQQQITNKIPDIANTLRKIIKKNKSRFDFTFAKQDMLKNSQTNKEKELRNSIQPFRIQNQLDFGSNRKSLQTSKILSYKLTSQDIEGSLLLTWKTSVTSIESNKKQSRNNQNNHKFRNQLLKILFNTKINNILIIMLSAKNFEKVKEIFEQNISGHLDEEQSSKSIQNLYEYREQLPIMINLIVLDLYHQQSKSYEESQLEVFFTNLRDFLDELIKQKIIREKDLILILNQKILDETEFIDANSLNKKMMQIYTLKNFKQNKFNLLCESTAGYSAFISRVLLQNKEQNANQIYDFLKEIIGFYNLDPNKIIEIIIDIFKCFSSQINFDFDLENQSILKALVMILRNLNKKNIKIIVLQRLLNLEQKDRAYSLLNVLAYFCKIDLLDYQFVFNNIHPKPEEIIDNIKSKNDCALKLFKEAFTIRLFKTEDEEQYNQQKIQALEKSYTESLNKNQKLEFLYALLNVNNYKEFKSLYDEMDVKIYFRKNEFYIEALFKIFNKFLKVFLQKQQNLNVKPKEFQLIPLYKNNSIFLSENLDLFLQQLQELLLIINTNISYDLETFENLLKVLNKLQQLNKKNFIEKIITQILLPSLFVKTLKAQQKYFCIEKMQNFLHTYSYKQRFQFYQKVQEKYLYENMFIMNPFVVNETKNFLNTICAGQNKELQNQIKMKQLLEENPFFVGLLILKEIQKYKSLIEILVASFQDINGLIKEIILWLILNEFQKSTIQSGDKISNEFQLLCLFNGKFLQANPEIEIEGVLTFILNKIAFTEGTDYLFFLVFKQMLVEILGYQIVQEANNNQLVGSLGGICLQVCTFQYTQSFFNSEKVRKIFCKTLLALKVNLNDEIQFSYFWIFYFHLCKNSIRSLYHASTFSVKTNNYLIDQIHETKQLLTDLIQFADADDVQVDLAHLNFVLENSMSLLPVDVLEISSMMFRQIKKEINEKVFLEYYELLKKYQNTIFKIQDFNLESFFSENCSQQNFEINQSTALLWFLKSTDIYYPEQNYLQMVEKYQQIMQEKNNENFEAPSNYQSKELYFQICSKQIDCLKQEQQKLQNHVQNCKSFVNKFCYKKIENDHQFLYQGLLLKLCKSTKNAYLCSQLYQMFYIKKFNNYNDLIGKNFRVIFKFISCLNGFTQDETQNFSQFFSFMFDAYQKSQDENFLTEIQNYLKRFQLDTELDIKEKEIQKTAENKFFKFVEMISKDFNKSSPVFAKNILIFLKNIMYIFPKNIKSIDILLKMLNENEQFINLYADLKLSCRNYQKHLEQIRQKQIEILYPPQNQQGPGSPQQSKASFAKRSQKSINRNQNSPESSKNYSRKYNNRNKDYQKQQGSRNQDYRQNRQRRNYRDRERDKKYYKKRN